MGNSTCNKTEGAPHPRFPEKFSGFRGCRVQEIRGISLVFCEIGPHAFASKGSEEEMRSKQVAESPKTFVVILDTGDEFSFVAQELCPNETSG